MAAYCTPTDVRNALAGTEALAGTAANLSDADLTAAITSAQAEVDAKLSVQYGPLIPFTAPPKLVVDMTTAIAAYLATLTYRRGDPIQPTEAVALAYQRAEALLTTIAAGKATLPTPDGAQGSEEAANPTAVVNNPVDGELWTAADYRIRPAAPAGVNSLVNPVWPWP